jgi:outer membrane protein OmpA-like peptidoglycan-associated protein
MLSLNTTIMRLVMNYFHRSVTLLFIALFSLAACADPSAGAQSSAQQSPHSTSVHSLSPQRVKAANSKHFYTQNTGGAYAQKIRSAGGIVIRRGQIMRVILPYSKFFESEDGNHVKIKRRTTLIALAKLLRFDYPVSPIRVIGYTDSSGTFSEQIARGRQVGDVVYSYLWDHNVSSHRMTLISGGSSKPVGSDAGFYAGWSDNRRVEVRVGLPDDAV